MFRFELEQKLRFTGVMGNDVQRLISGWSIPNAGQIVEVVEKHENLYVPSDTKFYKVTFPGCYETQYSTTTYKGEVIRNWTFVREDELNELTTIKRNLPEWF